MVGACFCWTEFLPGAERAEPSRLRSRLPSDNPPTVPLWGHTVPS